MSDEAKKSPQEIYVEKVKAIRANLIQVLKATHPDVAPTGTESAAGTQ